METEENLLKVEASPYLLQHANDLVNWHSWDERALGLARETNKPILLSIGYSSCHWCHVMAQESFSDAEIASFMNEHFINIKVDREERPDLDMIYQSAFQHLNQRAGGWPLTAFLSPKDTTPFYIGTYFPKTESLGLPAFLDVMHKVVADFNQQFDAIEYQNQQLQETLQIELQASDFQDDDEFLKNLTKAFKQTFDQANAGFGEEPKFAQEPLLDLLRCIVSDGQLQLLDAFNLTMQRMTRSGLYDHVGGGFFRYCVDAEWVMPHFEKMLYNNAQLLSLYASIAHEHPIYKRAVKETVTWALTEMQDAEGGFYSSLDADSENEEGKYYLWSKQELGSALTPDEFVFMSHAYGLNQPAQTDDRWHLQLTADSGEVAEQVQCSLAETLTHLTTSRLKLFQERNKKPRPFCDYKVITTWNGLMIKGLADASIALQNHEYTNSAYAALDFIYNYLWLDERLYANCIPGYLPKHKAYLNDYVFLIDGILQVVQVQWHHGAFKFAISLAEQMLELFEDKERGGFYFTANDHEQLIQRPKPFMDDAMPSGNAVAVSCLLKLGFILGESRYIESAERTLKLAWQSMQSAKLAHAGMIRAWHQLVNGFEIVVIRGNKDDIQEWQHICYKNFKPNRMVFAVENNMQDLPAWLEKCSPLGRTVAYVCEKQVCSQPILSLDDLLNL